MEDSGLDSPADLKMLTRLMTAGALAVIGVGVVAVIIGGHWYLLLLVVVPYIAIAATQWYVASRRVHHR